MNKTSKFPCPICKKLMWVVGQNNKGEKIGSCGHEWSFKRTRSQKEMDRKYITTPFGLEKRSY